MSGWPKKSSVSIVSDVTENISGKGYDFENKSQTFKAKIAKYNNVIKNSNAMINNFEQGS